MGTVTAPTAIATHETNNGFDNDNYTMSGTNSEIRKTTPSSSYTGASGLGYVYLKLISGSNFIISGKVLGDEEDFMFNHVIAYLNNKRVHFK